LNISIDLNTAGIFLNLLWFGIGIIFWLIWIKIADFLSPKNLTATFTIYGSMLVLLTLSIILVIVGSWPNLLTVDGQAISEQLATILKYTGIGLFLAPWITALFGLKLR
jgi:hypothetical protein